MRRSGADRILCTHGGNLPRPEAFETLLGDQTANAEAIERELPKAVQWVVDKQIACGVDVLNDGEYVKAVGAGDYHGYIQHRVEGWELLPADPSLPPKRGGTAERERPEFPGFYESGLWFSGSGGPVRPGFAKPGPPAVPKTQLVCTKPIRYLGYEAARKDAEALKTAIAGKPVDGFIAALGPLSLGAGVRNAYYPSEEEYMMAVADCLHEEYKTVTDAGLVLQVDEPEFATTWSFYPHWSVEDLRRYLGFAVEVINHAIRGLPSEQIRFHTCWGSGHRPHTHDIPLKDILDLMLKIDAQAYTYEASNVRHSHEWRIWEEVKLPEGKIIAPGVVGHYTDLIEHPDLVAERLVRLAELVGLENIQASTDCGIGSRVGHAEVVWAKLKAMSDGADIAAKRLKGR